MPLPLQPIPLNAFDTSVPPPQYSVDFASIVGNAVSDSDGFETIFSEIAGHLADAPNFLTGLDSIVDGLAGAGDPAEIPFEQDFSDTLASAISAGQGDFDTFAVHLTGGNPPPGGGGGGTGGGTAQCPLIDFGSLAANGPTGVLVHPVTVQLKNTSGHAITIKNTVISNDTSGTGFSVYPSVDGKHVAAGAVQNITIQFSTGSAGTFTANLTVNTDLPDPQPCLSLKATAFIANVGGGGSGGGSGGGGGGGAPDCGSIHPNWDC